MSQVNILSIVRDLHNLVGAQAESERETWLNALRAALVEGTSFEIKTPIVPKDFYLQFVPEAKRELTRAAAASWRTKIQNASTEYAKFRFDLVKTLGSYSKGVYQRNADLEHGDIDKQPAFFAVAESLGATGLEAWSLALATRSAFSFSDSRGNISCALNYLEKWETISAETPLADCITTEINNLIQSVGARLTAGATASSGGAQKISTVPGEIKTLSGSSKEKLTFVQGFLEAGKTVTVISSARQKCADGSQVLSTKAMEGIGSIIYLEKGWCDASFLESIAVK